MRYNHVKLAIMASFVGAAGLAGQAAHAATADATTLARIFTQVTVVNTSDLQFGTIVAAAAPSVVDISTTGARTCGAGLGCLGATSAADFLIGGSDGQVTTISVPASITLTSGSDTMLALLNPTSGLVTLASNAGAFSIGGTLLVGGGQAEGDYSGTFTATVNYQ